MSVESKVERRQSSRKPCEGEVEFFVDHDIIQASGIDISDTGFRFDTEGPLRLFMRRSVDGQIVENEMHLVRAHRRPDGSITYGLEFAG